MAEVPKKVLKGKIALVGRSDPRADRGIAIGLGEVPASR
jgi:hypothetical protein